MTTYHVRSKKYDEGIEVESVVNPIEADSEEAAINIAKAIPEYTDYTDHRVEFVES